VPDKGAALSLLVSDIEVQRRIARFSAADRYPKGELFARIQVNGACASLAVVRIYGPSTSVAGSVRSSCRKGAISMSNAFPDLFFNVHFSMTARWKYLERSFS